MSIYQNVHIGDVIPLDGGRKPFGEPCKPSWFVLTTGRQRRDMAAAKAWLERHGASECWFPVEERRVNRKRGYRLFREVVQIPNVPGIVFMLTDVMPQWDVLAERKRIRPLKIGEMPVIVSDSVMAEMETVPMRIEALRQEAEAKRHADFLANMPVAGSDAEFVVGPFKGHIVPVSSVAGAEAVVLIGGMKVTSNVATLKRRT